ncbi:hypothetical protein Taro_042273 [Colocasia esculenta]|uniref:Uncharacterized protein n=1 Tax=Colocasia esculenta TaxID=4460 RepID=A0A843WGE7_COLES|nr:hypothetical protein [Colocasia esculenta]
MASSVSSVPQICVLHPRDWSVSPSGSSGPWATVPMAGSLVGAGGPGIGAVTVDMPPRRCRQVRELMEHHDTKPDESVAAEHVLLDAQSQQFE